MKKIILVVSFSLVFLVLNSQTKFQSTSANANTPFLIENKGQWQNEVLYLSRLGNLNVWLTNDGFVMDFYKTNIQKVDYKNSEMEKFGQVVKLQFLNSNNKVHTQNFNQLPGFYNYFIGKDKSRWASNVGLYGKTRIYNIYNGIDVVYYFDNGYLCYNFVVHPGADYRQIKMRINGVENIRISNNNLTFDTRFGTVEMKNLFVYQNQNNQKNKINASWQLLGNTITFDIANYDKTKELIIDPVIYSTFIGGSLDDMAETIKIDEQGRVYIAGHTASTDFPTTEGSYDQTYNGGVKDIFVSFLNGNLGSLIFSTFIGGTDNHDGVLDLTYDNEKNIYCTGWTKCLDFPTTSGAYDEEPNGNRDVIAFKLNETGSQLLYSTVIGKEYDETGYSIAVDNLKTVFICGYTDNGDFPTTSNAYQPDGGLGYNHKCFVLRFNSSASQLLYSTFINNNSLEDVAYSLVLDDEKNAWITGYTYSSSFPVTIGQNNATASTSELFISVIDSLGQNLLKSRTFGGSASEKSYDIKRDAQNNVYICGTTTSTDFPITQGVFSTNNVQSWDAIVVKFPESLENPLFSTFIGGGGIDEAHTLALDLENNIYTTGITAGGIPTTSNAISTTINGGNNDAFIIKFNSTATGLLYSTYYGGNEVDFITDFELIDNHYVYLTGYTRSTNLPTTQNVLYPNFIGDNFYYCSFVSILDIQNVGIEDYQTYNSQIEIFPNPVTTSFTIRAEQSGYYTLYDINGRTISILQINANEPYVYTQKLPTGVYMLKGDNISARIIVK